MDVNECALQIIEEINRAVSGISGDDLFRFADRIRCANRIFLAGAGRSGFMVKASAMRLMHMGLKTHVVGETTTPGIEKGDLLIIGSGSGETASLAVMAQKAKKIGVDIALVTIHPQSSIGRYADLIIRIPATTPKSSMESGAKSIQPKGSLFEQSMFILFEAVILHLMEILKMEPEAIFSRHANLE